MTKTAKLNVQRWIYKRGNYEIILENAWEIRYRFTQERITVNGEQILHRKTKYYALFWWSTIYEDTVMDRDGEKKLKVQWKSGLKTMRVRLLIDGDEEEWTDSSETIWIGPIGMWPSNSEWLDNHSKRAFHVN